MYSIKIVLDGSVFNPSFENFFVNKKTNEERLAVTYEFGSLIFFADEFDYLYGYRVATYKYTLDCYLQKNGVDWIPCFLELIPGTFDIDKKTCELAIKSNDSTSKLLAGQSVKYNMNNIVDKLSCVVTYPFGKYPHTRVSYLFKIAEKLINKIDSSIVFIGNGTWQPGFDDFYTYYQLGISQISDFILNSDNEQNSDAATIWNLSFAQIFDFFYEFMNIDWYIDDSNIFRTVKFRNTAQSAQTALGNDLQTWKGVNWTKNKNVPNINKPNWSILQRDVKSIDTDFKGVNIEAANSELNEVKSISLNSFITDLVDINTRKKDVYGISNDVFALILTEGNAIAPPVMEYPVPTGTIFNVTVSFLSGRYVYDWGSGLAWGVQMSSFTLPTDTELLQLRIFTVVNISVPPTTPAMTVKLRLISGTVIKTYSLPATGGVTEFNFTYANLAAETYEIILNGDTSNNEKAVIYFEVTVNELTDLKCVSDSGALTGISKQNGALSIANLDRDFGSRFPQKQMSINGVSTSVDIADLDNFVQLTYDVPVLDVANDYDFTQKVKTDYSEECSLVSVKQNFVGKPSQITVKTKLL